MPGQHAEGMERMIVDVPEGTKANMKEAAAAQDLSMSQLVRKILRKYAPSKENA